MKFSRVRTWIAALAACAALACAALPSLGGDGGLAWRPTLDEGCSAAKQSGRPVLVLAIWKPGVCNACDTFRGQVQADARFLAAARRFELVEWHYDGLHGKVIPWTIANGGTSRDPSAQLFVVSPAGKLVARCPTEKTHVASQVADWLVAQADGFERENPRTAMPFRRAEVVLGAAVAGAGPPAASCAAAKEALDAGRPVAVYVGRDAVAEEKDEKVTKEERLRRAESAAAREFERKVLDSKSAAEAGEGWTLLRADLADPAHAAWAATLGVEKAPALLLLLPGEEKPVVLPRTITGPELASRLRRASKPPEPARTDAPAAPPPKDDPPARDGPPVSPGAPR